MKNNLLMRFRNIRTAIVVSFAVVVVFALLTFMLISLRYTQRTVLDNAAAYTSQLVSQVNNDIDSYISYMENISYIAVRNTEVRDYLFSKNLDSAGEWKLREQVLDLFETLTTAREDITNIGLLPDERDPIINDGSDVLNPYRDVTELSWYQAAIEAEGEAVISKSHVQNAIYDQYDWVVTLSRSITNRANPGSCAVIFVDLNYNSIRDLCESISLGDRGYIYILDSDGSIVYHPRQQLIYSGMRDELIEEVLTDTTGSFLTEDGSRLYTVSRSEATGWIVVGVSYVTELMQGSREAQLVYTAVAALLLLVALALAALISDQITRPITALESSMKEVQRGNFSYRAQDIPSANEIGSLSRSFEVMTREIQNLMEQNIRDQEDKRRYELRVLQSQINPHFLYNTLDSIIWMAEWGKNQEVVKMTSSLAVLLRQSISNEQEVVTIGEEVGYTEAYLTIQKMRYQDKLEYEIQVDGALRGERIVKLVLQPLVENAIYHGIKYREGKGLIRVLGFYEEDEIVLQVEDNGPGMDEDTLAHIFERHIRDTRSNGVGVNNVNERIRLYYGADCGLRFKSRPGMGTRAEIRIPAGREEEGEHEEECEDQ